MDFESIKASADLSGKCGEHLHWFFLDDTLYIEGTGTLIAEDRFDWGTKPAYLQGVVSRVVIAEGCDRIDFSAFYCWNNLRSASFPASLFRVGYPQFDRQGNPIWVEKETLSFWDLLADCPNLESISVHKDNPQYATEDGVLFDKQMQKLLFYPQGKYGPYSIPPSVTVIGECAFSECGNLTEVTIPENVKRIEEGAFECCQLLNSLVIPDSVTEIGDGAFRDIPAIFYHGPARSDNNWGAKSRN